MVKYLVGSLLILLMLFDAPVQAEPALSHVKIEVAEDSLYRVTYADLEAIGWAVDEVDPHRLTLMHRGEAVALQFVGDEDSFFEAGEAIEFYGWAFDGAFEERQYVTNNVFWLTAATSSEPISQRPNATDLPVRETVATTVTTEPENVFTTTYTNFWEHFENDFDAWYWDSLAKDGGATQTYTFTVDVPFPAAGLTYSVELFTDKHVTGHEVGVAWNGVAGMTRTWNGKSSLDFEGVVTAENVQTGANQLTITLATPSSDRVFLNSVSVTYDRFPQVVADELTFDLPANSLLWLDGFTTDGVQVWEITDRYQPQVVVVESADFSPNNDGTFRVRVGSHTAARYVATTHTATPVRLSTYTPQELTPPSGEARWLAIAPTDLLPPTEFLGLYRAAHSHISTHVVDVEDVVNQYGHGLPTPQGVQAFVRHAAAEWGVNYVLLVGDATQNPRQLPCDACGDGWTTTEQTDVPTFLLPLGRFVGMIPTDHPYALLSDGSHRPDLSVGRLPASTVAELENMVDKIIQYEINLSVPDEWMEQALFLADNSDNSGDFCGTGEAVMGMYPDSFEEMLFCLSANATADEVEAFRNTMFDKINAGVLVVQYTGHGSIDGWASEGILQSGDVDRLTNAAQPYVQMSGNCLDANFAWVGLPSISETFLAAENGPVAHWGSTSLDYLFENRQLQFDFYDALFNDGVTAIGDAIRSAKTDYLTHGFYSGQVYASTLLGDPAMQMMQPDWNVSLLEQTEVSDTETSVRLHIVNEGLFPSAGALEVEIPANLHVQDIESSVLANIEVIENRLHITFDEAMGIGDSAELRFEVNNVSRSSPTTITATISGNGFETSQTNNYIVLTLTTNAPTAITLSQLKSEKPPTLLWLGLLLLGYTLFVRRQNRSTANF